MKQPFITLILLALLVVFAACSNMRPAKTPTESGHPALSEQEMLIPCSACHQDVTPTVYSEWYDSTHGIGNVKCYQCHGTYEELTVSPNMSRSCGACHADKLGDHTGSQVCWECHRPHSFSSAE